MSVLMHEVIGCVVLVYLSGMGPKERQPGCFFSTIVHPLSISKTSFCKIHHNSNTSSFTCLQVHVLIECMPCPSHVLHCICLLSTGMGPNERQTGCFFSTIHPLSISKTSFCKIHHNSTDTMYSFLCLHVHVHVLIECMPCPSH